MATAGDAFLTATPLEEEDFGLMRTAEQMAAMQAEPEEATVSDIDPKARKLLDDAVVRAEQQEKARQTMLTLAKALEDALAQQGILRRRIEEEQLEKAKVYARLKGVEEELEDAHSEIEKRDGKELIRKGMASGNKLFVSMMIEKSRQVYQSNHFENLYEEVDPADAAMAAQGSTSRELPLGDAGSTSRDLALGGAVAESAPKAPSGNVFDNVQDRVTFNWMFEYWRQEVVKGKKKRAEEAAERERIRLEEERQRKMREEIERRVAEVKAKMKELEKQLLDALDDLEKRKIKIRDLEARLADAMGEADRIEKKYLAIVEELRKDLMDARQKLSDAEQDRDRLQKELTELDEAYRKAKADWDAEQKRLQAEIRQLSSELQQALTLAKFLKEQMLRAKRDAAGAVSPQKLAELIAQLEEIKERLSSLQRDYDAEKDANFDLMQKIDKNKRRLELERQFLPLIRQARGPLGPKPEKPLTGVVQEAKRKDGWDVPDGSPETSPDVTRRMQRSQSMVNQRTGAPKGLPLAGGGPM